MGHRCFEVEWDGPVVHLRMSRPDELNSMVSEFWSELPAIVREVDDTGRARAIVLSSTGRHFTAGLDLGAIGGLGGGGGSEGASAEIGRVRANIRAFILHLQEAFTCLEKARMPVLVAVQGGCVGGGVDLVSACDMRYCTEDAFFCVQEINIGITADVGTLQRLPKIIPEGIARELAYTGARMPAARAREVGLVNAVYPDHAALIEGVSAIAHEIAERSPLAIWGTKEMLNYSRDHTVADGLNYIATWQTGMFQTPDIVEAFEARQEGRKPAYADLLPARRKM